MKQEWIAALVLGAALGISGCSDSSENADMDEQMEEMAEDAADSAEETAEESADDMSETLEQAGGNDKENAGS